MISEDNLEIAETQECEQEITGDRRNVIYKTITSVENTDMTNLSCRNTANGGEFRAQTFMFSDNIEHQHRHRN